MKTIYKISLCILIGALVACDPDRVDTEPLGATENTFFSNVIEFRRVVVGAYSKLYDHYHLNRGQWPNSLWLLPGDDLTETQGSRTAEELFDGNMSSTNPRLEWMFDNTYEMIAKCNVVIQKVNTVDFSQYEGADEIAYMEGEGLFIRAYSYFVLFNIFGNVPLVIDRITTPEATNTPVSPMADVLDQVILDAENAISILPESWDPIYAGRATKNSARGLLAKALVFRGNYAGSTADFTQAISVFNSISGASLMTSYLDNFDEKVENNAESLFEIQGSKPPAINNIFLYNDGPWRGVENMSLFRGMMRPAGKGTASDQASTRFLVTDKLFNNFGTDPRISYFLQPDDNEGGKMFQKYTLDELDSRPSFGASVNNERVLRYGDIKLLIAEAELKAGTPAAAIGHINDIRTRARDWGVASGEGNGVDPANHSTSETNAATIMQWIMDERFVELAGEGQRWWDLKRWHVGGDIDLTGWGSGDQHFSSNLSSASQFNVDTHLIFPIPQVEISRNSAILNNNPGY